MVEDRLDRSDHLGQGRAWQFAPLRTGAEDGRGRAPWVEQEPGAGIRLEIRADPVADHQRRTQPLHRRRQLSGLNWVDQEAGSETTEDAREGLPLAQRLNGDQNPEAIIRRHPGGGDGLTVCLYRVPVEQAD